MGNPEPPPPISPGVRRRDVLIGGLAGLAGGAVLGRAAFPSREVEYVEAEPRMPDGANPSFAQCGEDLVAGGLFSSLGVKQPTYLDIGAADPMYGNNTYVFYLAGSRGVLVEPDVSLTDRLKMVRPRDTLLVAGIGTEETAAADYYVMSIPGWNTFDKEQAERLVREANFRIERVVRMPLFGINRVIAENFAGKAPDYISIDIEGLDYDVMKNLDFSRYRPKVICAETIITNTLRHNPRMTTLLCDHGYEVRGMTYPNTFYVDKALLG
ncbi:MAG TPA: FkbM family methyltransferase [Gemmata sp.]|nr:FkbM family methyltransferase [Gemmata sp.]